MPEYFFWPYDEVAVERSPHGLSIRSPWIEAQLPATEENSDEMDRLMEALQTGPSSREKAQLVSDYFEPLDEHSLCYVLPSALPAGLDRHVANADLQELSFPWLLSLAVEASESLTAEEKSALLPQVAAMATDWGWDFDAARAFSLLGDEGLHPQSLLSIARRYHLLSLVGSDRGREIFELVRELPDAPFHRAVTSLVRQNHYVTEKCAASLAPAVAISGRARERVEAFMREERGHDRILGRALSSLGVNPTEVAVTAETRALMCLLEFAARRNFLAFAIAIEFFERRGYEKSEPLAELLRSRGFDEAAKRLNQHKDINDHGEHHGTARGFLEWMAPVSAEYALEAMRMAEATSRLMARVSASAVTLASA